jgi:SAM-dependent methyltransferase
MNLNRVIYKGLKLLGRDPYQFLDGLYLPLDRRYVRRTNNIQMIPVESHRRGGKYSYAEWAHVVGIFQTLIFLQLEKKGGSCILDIGCGTGLLGIACKPFITEGGRYTGLDVNESDIAFCREHYQSPEYQFIHFDLANAAYAPHQADSREPWPLDNESFELALALSVWTHMNQEDAVYYFGELSRILKPKGKAIITFFILDAQYEKTLAARGGQFGKFHHKTQDRLVFDQPAYGSTMWFHPAWTSVPEDAIAITEDGLKHLLAKTELRVLDHYQGNWKETPGIYYQDVVVFEKA